MLLMSQSVACLIENYNYLIVIFNNELNCENCLQQHGREISHQELTRCLAQQWNNLTQGEKMVFNNLLIFGFCI